jgi:DNA modification methylase
MPGATVLDPMMGSGTTIVEAFLTGRYGIGVDLDPLALRICQVKVTPLDATTLHTASTKLLARASRLMDSAKVERELERRFDGPTRKFIDYWFLPATQRELLALILSIESVSEPDLRRLFELCFSSIIITKSGGVSMARDLAHSRPHLDESKQPRNALEQYNQRLKKSLKRLEELGQGTGRVCIQNGDARRLALANNSIDLVVTSPPYANAIDYMRAHKFSLVWLGRSVDELSDLRSTYIGSEKASAKQYAALPDRVEATVQQLAVADKNKAAILRKYFSEMRESIREMGRVLKSGSAAILVVGTSTMRGIDVQTHSCLADIGANEGLDVVSVAQRALDRNRRMMPARFGKKSDSMIEQRMHEEFVIGLLKP